MTHSQRRIYLINELLSEKSEYKNIEIPYEIEKQEYLLRSLFNIREPRKPKDEFLSIQDKYLQEEIQKIGITDISDLKPVKDNIYLWKGDITTLRADAIVNAANNKMQGCFIPCHSCIDNAIHTFAGVQLRLECSEIIAVQGQYELTGKAKITSGYNLPAKHILHTVGPIVTGDLTEDDCQQLSSCYRSCLELTDINNIKSIAFCCISTGEFHFPNQKAAEIAIHIVKNFIEDTKSEIKVIFNVFKENDYEIYHRILS